MRSIVQAQPIKLCWPCSLCVLIALLTWSTAPGIAQSHPSSSSTSLQGLKHAADNAREQGNIQESLTLYRKALKQDEHWQEGWWYLGSLLYDAGRYDEARPAFQKLVQLNAALADAWAMLGLSAYEGQDYSAAFDALDKAQNTATPLDTNLQNVADYHLALLLNLRGDSDAASMLLSSLFLRGVHSENLQVALGLALLRVPILPQQLDPSRDALVHEAGNVGALCADRKFDKAELAFTDLISHYPNTPFLHYAFGSMLSSEGRDKDAEEQFRQETTLNPDSALAYMEWAFLESKSKHYAESRQLAQKAVDLSSQSFMAHYLLGNALLNSGEVKAAVPELESAQKLAPEVADIRYSLSRAYARLGDVVMAKQEQSAFIALQRKNAIDRSALRQKYPSAQPITGVRPITPEQVPSQVKDHTNQ